MDERQRADINKDERHHAQTACNWRWNWQTHKCFFPLHSPLIGPLWRGLVYSEVPHGALLLEPHEHNWQLNTSRCAKNRPTSVFQHTYNTGENTCAHTVSHTTSRSTLTFFAQKCRTKTAWAKKLITVTPLEGQQAPHAKYCLHVHTASHPAKCQVNLY